MGSRPDRRRNRKSKNSFLDDPQTQEEFQNIERSFRESDEFNVGKQQPHSSTSQPYDNSIGNQKVTNKESIGNQLVTQKVTNKESIGNQELQKESTKKPIGNQLVTQKVTTLVTNKEPIGNQLVTKTAFKELSGIQKMITLVIFNDLKFSNKKVSSPISLSYFAEIAETTTRTAKTATQRLVKKGVIKREGGKRGKGGWAQFSIPSSLYNEMLQSELVTNKESIGNQLVTNWWPNREPNRESSLPSSSSIYNNKTTTTGAAQIPGVTWNLDLSKYPRVKIGPTQIKQVQDSTDLTKESVRKSLDAFQFDLENDKLQRPIHSPINFIMKILRNGGEYISDHYEDPEETLFREQVEKSKRKREEREKLESEKLENDFQNWLSEKSDEEISGICAPVLTSVRSMLHQAELKNWFKENIY